MGEVNDKTDCVAATPPSIREQIVAALEGTTMHTQQARNIAEHILNKFEVKPLPRVTLTPTEATFNALVGARVRLIRALHRAGRLSVDAPVSPVYELMSAARELITTSLALTNGE